jgi:hypothetical protein
MSCLNNTGVITVAHMSEKHWCRSGPMIFGILQTWHTHLWHQHIFDMTLTFVYFTWHLYLWQQCFSDITATFMTPVFFRNNSNIYDISVFSDMTTSVFISDNDVINVAVMSEKHACLNVDVMRKIHWCHQCICHVWKKH